eukprot:1067399-Rhodomonas_salina.1
MPGAAAAQRTTTRLILTERTTEVVLMQQMAWIRLRTKTPSESLRCASVRIFATVPPFWGAAPKPGMDAILMLRMEDCAAYEAPGSTTAVRALARRTRALSHYAHTHYLTADTHAIELCTHAIALCSRAALPGADVP